MKSKNVINAVLTAVLMLGLAYPGFSMYVGNTSGKSFDESGTGSGTMANTSSALGAIEDLVIRSATFFLKGKAHVDLLASSLEAADHDGVSYSQYQMIANDALEAMKMARYYYQSLISTANQTPYNPEIINQLNTFDYNRFSQEYGLNSDIFDQVKTYLGGGDVRGAYVRLYTYTDNIVNMLETVQEEVYNSNFPATNNIWRLNQECAQMLLFGQYMAQVFYQVQ